MTGERARPVDLSLLDRPDHPDFPPPPAMMAGGQPRFAFVTFMVMNDHYLVGALMTGYALRRRGTAAALVCLIDDKVSTRAADALGVIFDHVLRVPPLMIRRVDRQRRQDLPYLFTRFQGLRLGLDGDLGPRFERIVMLDADVVALCSYDHLFTLNTPAAILNERPERLAEKDAAGQFRVDEAVLKTGRWHWHEEFDSVAPHGAPIPPRLTERVAEDPGDMGINGAVVALTPSRAAFDALCADLADPETEHRVAAVYRWPDMQYISHAWSPDWHNIDARFAGYNGYPSLAVLFGTHYAGMKPWRFKDAKAMRRFARYPDFQLWFALFDEMIARYPALMAVPGVRKTREGVAAYRVTPDGESPP